MGGAGPRISILHRVSLHRASSYRIADRGCGKKERFPPNNVSFDTKILIAGSPRRGLMSIALGDSSPGDQW